MFKEISKEQFDAVNDYSRTLEQNISRLFDERLSHDARAVVNHILTIIDIHRELARIDMEYCRGKEYLDKVRQLNKELKIT